MLTWLDDDVRIYHVCFLAAAIAHILAHHATKDDDWFYFRRIPPVARESGTPAPPVRPVDWIRGRAQ